MEITHPLIPGREGRCIFIFPLIILISIIFMSVGYGLNWGNQGKWGTCWYRTHLDEINTTLELGISEVYIDGLYQGNLPDNCILNYDGMNLTVFGEDECIKFFDVQALAHTTMFLSYSGFVFFMMAVCGIIKPSVVRCLIAAIILSLTSGMGIATLTRHLFGPPFPGWFISSWLISVGFGLTSTIKLFKR